MARTVTVSSPAPATQRVSGPSSSTTSAKVVASVAPPQRDEAVEFVMNFKRVLIPYLVQSLNPYFLQPGKEQELRESITELIDEKLTADKAKIGGDLRVNLLDDIINELVGYGPLEHLLRNPDVTEIMVNGFDSIYARLRDGTVSLTPIKFINAENLRLILDRMLSKTGRRLRESFSGDGAAPVVDVRLPDGTRVHVVDTPLYKGTIDAGPCVTIRKASGTMLSMSELAGTQVLSMEAALFLQGAVDVGANIVVCGGAGSGKTVLLNALCGFISRSQRIVVLEDTVELNFTQPHVVRLTTQGKPAAARELLGTIGGMCPDRIVLGECRGPEALEMIRAMTSGGPGIMTALNAASPVAAVARLETMMLGASSDAVLAPHVVRRQIAEAIQIVLHISRLRDGTHRLTRIAEIQGIDNVGAVILRDIFRCEQAEAGGHIAMAGRGVVPRLHAEFKSMELEIPEEIYGNHTQGSQIDGA